MIFLLAVYRTPCAGQILSFDVQTNKFVQILHSSGNHLITISIVGMDHSHIRVYDSQVILPDDT